MKLIDKDSLVSEIERVLDNAEEVNNTSYILLCNHLKDFINTLEMKEVDLDFTKEVDVWVRDNGDTNGFFNVQELAKHFFELGFKSQKGE